MRRKGKGVTGSLAPQAPRFRGRALRGGDLRGAFVDLSANCASINMRIRRWVGILTFAACALSDGPPCQNPSRGDASAHGGVRNNFDLDFTGPVAAAFDVQTLNVGMLNIPDAGVIITC